LCEAKALADALGWMQQHYHLGEPSDPQGLPDDDPPWWCEYMRAHPGAVKFDHDCSIFMNAGSELNGAALWGYALVIHKNGRPWNVLTGEYPCIFHFNGGYSHSEHGKWPQLEPYWKACGYTERPPWEK